MTFDPERTLLMVRAEGSDPNAPGAPDVSGTNWTASAIGDDWFALRPASGERFVVCHRENGNGTRGLYSLHGPTDLLATIAGFVDLAMPAAEAWRRRTESGVARYLRWWRTWRVSGFERDSEGATVAVSNVRRVVMPDGSALGTVSADGTSIDSLPWDLGADGQPTTQAAAVRRVTALSPALDITLAGFALASLFEAEPDSGAL